MPKSLPISANLLSSFDITQASGDYIVRVEDESGQVVEFVASYEQLELISETIEKILDEDEEAGTEVDDDDEDEDGNDDD